MAVDKRKLRGPDHPGWIGDAATVRTGRCRARRAYPPRPCESCGNDDAERHHVDDNTLNNEPENIRFLCRRCHMEEDGRLARLAAAAATRSPELTAAAATARRARTECKRGHPLSGDNLYIAPSGSRVCKTCRALHSKNSQRRKAQRP